LEDKILQSMKESGVKVDELPLGALDMRLIEKARECISKLQALETPPQEEDAVAVQARLVHRTKVKMHSDAFFEKIPSNSVEAYSATSPYLPPAEITPISP
jgi:hypothetical protein